MHDLAAVTAGRSPVADEYVLRDAALHMALRRVSVRLAVERDTSTTPLAAKERGRPVSGGGIEQANDAITATIQIHAPILANSCYFCHTDQQNGGFRIDNKKDFEKGGKHGPEVIPGSPEKSRSIQAVERIGPIKMPAAGPKLTPQDVATLVARVKAGAKWPDNLAPIGTTATTGIITERQREFGSCLPLKDQELPAVSNRHYKR